MIVFSPGLRHHLQCPVLVFWRTEAGADWYSQGCSGIRQRKCFLGEANKIGQSFFPSLLRSYGSCYCWGMAWGCWVEIGGAVLRFPSSSSPQQWPLVVLPSSVSFLPLLSVLPPVKGAIYGVCFTSVWKNLVPSPPTTSHAG